MLKRALAALLAACLLLEAPGATAWAAVVRGEAPRDHAAAPAPVVALPDLPALPAAAPGLEAGVPPVAGDAAAVPSPAAAPAAPVEAASGSQAAAASASEPARADEQAAAEGRREFDLAARRPDSADPVVATARRAPLPRSVLGAYLGHGVLTVLGINFHVIAQPFLVQDALALGPRSMGVVRNIHMGAMALVNLLPVGALIDRTDYRVVFIATSVVRAALMASIPLLFHAGLLHFTMLAAVVAVNPLFQSVMLVADGAAIKAFLGKDEKLNKDATATMAKWDAIGGALMPLAAGAIVNWLVASTGLGGYALAYGIYAGLLLASIPVYWRMVRDPRFPQNDRLTPGALARQSAVFMLALLRSMIFPVEALWRRLRRPRADAAAAAAPKGATLAERLERHDFLQGFAFILRSRVLTVLAVMTAVEMFMLDALPFVVLPSLITGAIGAGPAWMPLVATAGGILGLLSSLEYLGRYIPAARLEGDRGDALIERAGRGSFYKRAAAASLLFWALLIPAYLTPGVFWANIAIVGGVLFTVQFFHSAVPIVIAPVKRREIDDDKIARVESAFFMIDLAFEAAGALALGLVLDVFGLRAGLVATAAFFTLTAVFQWLAPRWLDPPEKG